MSLLLKIWNLVQGLKEIRDKYKPQTEKESIWTNVRYSTNFDSNIVKSFNFTDGEESAQNDKDVKYENNSEDLNDCDDSNDSEIFIPQRTSKYI